MRRQIRIAIALGVLVLAAWAALAAQARSSAASWGRISGPTEPGAELGLARTADGVLHVVWNRGRTPTSILETRLSPTGRTIGTSTVASGFDGNGGLALLALPDRSLRLFAAGAAHPGSATSGITTFTAPEAGGSWSLQSPFWGGAVAASASVIGATLTKDGQTVTAWRGYAGEGIPAVAPANPDVADQTASALATDAASGGVVLAGVTIAGKGGVYAQQILPTRGPSVLLPLPNGQNDWNSGASGRSGAPGVYVAYGDGKAARLYRYGGASKTLARGPYTSATACSGPDGRLWVAWGNGSTGLFVTRSSRAVSGFEPVQKLKLPGGTQAGVTYLQCEGSAGPLDLFADVQIGASGGFWHAHVLGRLSVGASVAKGKATVTVRDAGDPVAGASVSVGGRHASTDAQGRVALALRKGSYAVMATASGYAPASVRLTVR